MTLSEQWASLVRISLQCRRPWFNPWVGKIPWRRERLPTPVFWPGEFHSPWGLKESDTTERLPWASLVAQMVKRLTEMRETGVGSQGWEDPLEKEMATHSSILAEKIPWTDQPAELQSIGFIKSDTTEYTCIYLICVLKRPKKNE